MSILNAQAANASVKAALQQFPIAAGATSTVTVNGQSVPVGNIQLFAPDFYNQHDFQTNLDAYQSRVNKKFKTLPIKSPFS
jgi:hypothetical protein